MKRCMNTIWNEIAGEKMEAWMWAWMWERVNNDAWLWEGTCLLVSIHAGGVFIWMLES